MTPRSQANQRSTQMMYVSLDPCLPHVQKMSKLINMNLVCIVKVQSFIRRALSKARYKQMIEERDMYRMHARYFTRVEIYETLSKTERIGPDRDAHHIYENGSRYEGKWRGGFRHGRGKMVWADGASYQGEWSMGYAEGNGVFLDCLGNKYEGNFMMSMAHGHGVYTNTHGAVYEGAWHHDMQYGKGTETWRDSLFEGNFVGGLRNGHGVWITDTKRYDGNWVNNMMDGYGVMQWTKGQHSSDYHATPQKKSNKD